MIYYDYFVLFFISEFDVEDVGKVKCKVVNEYGEIFIIVRIFVEGKLRLNN